MAQVRQRSAPGLVRLWFLPGFLFCRSVHRRCSEACPPGPPPLRSFGIVFTEVLDSIEFDLEVLERA